MKGSKASEVSRHKEKNYSHGSLRMAALILAAALFLVSCAGSSTLRREAESSPGAEESGTPGGPDAAAGPGTSGDPGSAKSPGASNDQNAPGGAGLSDPVVFKDPYLEKEILSALGMKGPLTRGEAAGVRSLILAHTKEERGSITDLTGLSCFTGLIELDLANNRVTDLSELSGLKELKTLHLEGNEITDVKPLASLTGLTLLDLEGNQISSIYWLDELTELTVFDIRNNYVSDISVIANMKDEGLDKVDFVMEIMTRHLDNLKSMLDAEFIDLGNGAFAYAGLNGAMI